MSADDPDISKITAKNTPRWHIQFPKGRIRAMCTGAYDGDTCTLGFRLAPGEKPFLHSCRMLGYNSAEMKSKDPEEVATAIRNRDAIAKLILDKEVDLEIDGVDMYARPLVNVWTRGNAPIHVNMWMIESRNGFPYSGRGEKKWK